MQESLLKTIHEKRKLDVPLTKLIQQHKLDITHPTLSRMLTHYEALVSPDIVQANAERIRASLFPEWLAGPRAVVSQPADWYYTGMFPLGEWRRR